MYSRILPHIHFDIPVSMDLIFESMLLMLHRFDNQYLWLSENY